MSVQSQPNKVINNKPNATIYIKNSLHSNFDILKQAQKDGLDVDLIGRFNDIVQVSNKDNTVNLVFIYAKHNGVEALYSFTGYRD